MNSEILYKPIAYQYRKPENKINKYTIIGERHSGTNWLERICQNRLELSITWEYGSKHFFNYSPNTLASAQNTLFICITRNVYDWIGGFFKLPHHVDISIAYNIDKFLLSEWKCDDRVNDVDYLTNKPYQNIFQLRKYKLQFFDLFLPFIVDNMIITRYEDLLIDPETIVSFISKIYNIKKTTYDYYNLTQPRKQHPYLFDERISNIINEYTDWDMENKFGYLINNR